MFEFNQWSSPLLPGFLQGVVFAVILTLRGYREERISDYLAALLLLFGSLYVAQWMLGFGGWYDQRDWRTTIMFYVQWKHVLAFGPLIWLYFRSLTNTDFRWRRAYWWHFLPLGLAWLEPIGIALYDWVWYRGILGQPFTCFDGSRGPAAEWGNSGGLGFGYYVVTTVLGFVHLFYYLLRTIGEYRNYRRYLLAEFSNAEQLTFSGLRLTLYLMLTGTLVTFLLEIGNQAFNENYVDSWDSYFAMSVFVFFAAIQLLAIDPASTRALRFDPAEPRFSVPSPEPAPAAAATPSPATATLDPDLERWLPKLQHRLATHDDHLNPELKLGDLAEALGTNTSVLSKVINGHYGKNFNDFVNDRRCAAFRQRIEAGEHERHTLLSIALDCGFNSKSTFNRAFRKCTGMSPGQAVKVYSGGGD